MKIHTLSLIIASSVLVACSTANNIEVIAGPDTVIPLHQQGEQAGRYHNLYPGKKVILLAVKLIATQKTIT